MGGHGSSGVLGSEEVPDRVRREHPGADDDARDDEHDGTEDREVLVGETQVARSDGEQHGREEARGEGRLLLGRVAQEAVHQRSSVHRGTAAMARAASRSACARAVVTAALAVASSARRLRVCSRISRRSRSTLDC